MAFRTRQLRLHSSSRYWPSFLSKSLLFLAIVLPRSVSSQDLAATPSAAISSITEATGSSPTVIDPGASFTTFYGYSVPTPLSSDSSATDSTFPTVIESTPSRSLIIAVVPTGAGPSDDPTDPSQNPADERNRGLFEYYFVFIAILVVCVFMAGYFVHKRKTRRKETSRNSSQDALARDVVGWTTNGGGGSRRWISYGNWRSGRASQPGGRMRRDQEEGLDENGEAPPPYTNLSQGGDRDAVNGGPSDVPLHMLPRPGHESAATAINPPDYETTTRSTSIGSSGGGGGSSNSNTVRHSRLPPSIASLEAPERALLLLSSRTSPSPTGPSGTNNGSS